MAQNRHSGVGAKLFAVRFPAEGDPNGIYTVAEYNRGASSWVAIGP